MSGGHAILSEDNNFAAPGGGVITRTGSPARRMPTGMLRYLIGAVIVLLSLEFRAGIEHRNLDRAKGGDHRIKVGETVTKQS